MFRSLVGASTAVLAGLVVAASAQGQTATPLPNPNQLNKTGRAPHCQAAIDEVMAEEAKFLQKIDALAAVLQTPEDAQEKAGDDALKALTDLAGLCSSCVIDRKADAIADERRQKQLEKSLCSLTAEKKEVYAIAARLPQVKTATLLLGPVVLTLAEFDYEMTRLRTVALLNHGPTARLTSSNTYGTFSCGFVYESSAGELKFGTSSPDALAKTMADRARFGAKIVGPGVCRD